MLAKLRLAASYRIGHDDPAPGLAAIGDVLATGTGAPEAFVVAGDLYRKAGKHLEAERALRAAMRMHGGGAVVAEGQAVLASMEQ